MSIVNINRSSGTPTPIDFKTPIEERPEAFPLQLSHIVHPILLHVVEDASFSMAGAKIASVNQANEDLARAVQGAREFQDFVLRLSSFNHQPLKDLLPWSAASSIREVPHLAAGGGTHLCEAVVQAVHGEQGVFIDMSSIRPHIAQKHGAWRKNSASTT